jgi:uncharacterized membrane protein YdjX (TVP38/TMEM64 family)
MEVLEALNELINNLLNLLGSWGALLGCVFILFESIIPMLPLSLFITLNFVTFGSIIGFIISWVFTVLGCMMSYYLFKSAVSEKRLNKFKENNTLKKVINVIENMNFTSLVILIAIPFTPAFAVNIAAGICRVPKKKFLLALMLGKISLVYFWGYVGVGLIESLKNPSKLIGVVILIVIVYIISYILSKKLKIK